LVGKAKNLGAVSGVFYNLRPLAPDLSHVGSE
jgi:hypothetical protein